MITLSNQFWQRLSFLAGLISIGVLFGLAVFSASVEIKDLDLWLHIGTGRYIAANGYVPAHDVLSCTIAGKPWVNHEWLFQLLVYQVHQWGGADGLITMQTVVVAATFLILLLLFYRRDRQWLVVFMLLLVLMVYQTRFTIRPDIFSLLFFTLFITAYRHLMDKVWVLYALLGVQLLWVNMHGFFFLGPLLMWVAYLAQWVKRRIPLPWEWNTVGRLGDEAYKRLGLIAVALLFVCLLNPLTLKGALYPLTVFFQLGGDSKIFFKHIYELQKPISVATLWSSNYMYYKILIVLSAYSFLINRRRLDLTMVLLWAAFLLFSLAAIRNLIFFAFGAYIVFMVNTASIQWRDIIPFTFANDKFKYITGIFAKLLLTCWMVNTGLDLSVNGYFDYSTYERKSEFWGVSKRNYPTKAVDFLVKNKVKANIFNDFNSGAYLVGRTHPNIKVFIDGRTEQYGSAFFEQYQKIWKEGDRKLFDDFARRYNITGAFLNSANQEIPAKVVRMFYEMKDWSVVYFDDDAVIFLKQHPAHKAIIDRHALDLATHEPKGIDLLRLGPKRIDPYIFTNRAYTLESMGLYEPALKEAAMALKIAPDWVPAYKLMGKIYGQQGKHRKAFEYLRIAVMYNPRDLQTRGSLALAYEKLKDYKGAIKQYERMIEDAPQDPKGYFGLAKVYALQGKSRKAIETLKTARQLASAAKPPKDKVDVQQIRDIISQHQLNKEMKHLLDEVTR